MRLKNKISLGLAVATAALILSAPVFAQVNNAANSTIGTAFGLGTNTDIRLAIIKIVQYLLGFLGLVAVLIVAYAGFMWMTAAGNAQRIERARQILINGLIGLAIILSAFLIVSYLISTLSGLVTGNNPGGGGGGGCNGPGCIGGGGGTDFVVTGFSPAAPPTLNPQNSIVRVFVSMPVVASSVTNSSIIVTNTTLSPNVQVVGTVAVSQTSNQELDFTPSMACPAPIPTQKCFDKNDTYSVAVSNSLQGQSAGLPVTLNCNLNSCQYQFLIGDQMDTHSPSVAITAPLGRAMISQTPQSVSAHATDDFGLSNVQFYFKNLPSGSRTGLGGPVIANGVAFDATTSTWDTSAYQNGDMVQLESDAYDQTANPPGIDQQTVVMRPAHCFNHTKDSTETDIDCGGDPHDPEYCGACAGQSCNATPLAPQCTVNQSACGSTLLCDQSASCTCQATPVITNFDPGDGHVGNYITITGNAFGTSRGTVTFLGDGTAAHPSVNALFPNVPNCPASGNWTCDASGNNCQIIIEVAPNTPSGPIQVTRTDGKSDATNDAVGPHLPDYSNAGPVRPGLACLSTYTGKYNDSVIFRGKNFDQNAIALFGNAPGPVAAPPASGNGFIQAPVPNISPSTFGALVQVGNEVSNHRDFTVIGSGTAPTITNISPDNGPDGQYVTISGTGFGQSGTVYFEDCPAGGCQPGVPTTGTPVAADTNFPQACSNNLWRDTQIIIKVPGGLHNTAPAATPTNNEKLWVSVGAQHDLSNAVDFSHTNAPLGPGLCAIDPTLGPLGTPVTVYGERLGDGSNNAGLKFNTSRLVCNNNTAQSCVGNRVCNNDATKTCTVNSDCGSGTCVAACGSGQCVSANGDLVQWQNASNSADWLNTPINPVSPVWNDNEVRGGKAQPTSITGPVTAVTSGHFVCSDAPTISCDPDSTICATQGHGNCIYATESNGLNFTVGSCNADADCGGGGEHCCTIQNPDGSNAKTCQLTCPTPTYAVQSYRWRFTTSNPSPQVVEQQSCGNGTQSPSPWRGSTDACANANVSVRFTTMLRNTLPDLVRYGTALSLGDCGSDPQCQHPTNVAITSGLVPAGGPGDVIQTNAAPAFVTGHYYIATVDHTKIFSDQGVGMKADYSWTFQISTTCTATSVQCVAQNGGVITSVAPPNNTSNLSASLQAANCNILSCAAGDIASWTSQNASVATVPASASCTNVATGIAEGSTTVKIKATNATTTDGSCPITVNLPPLTVVDHYPGCSLACLNAAVGAKFSTAIKLASATGKNTPGGNPNGTVQLWKCADANCDLSTSTEVPVTAITPIPTMNPTEIQLANITLSANTYYRVVLMQGIQSVDAKPLSGLNFATQAGHALDSYSWVFGVGTQTCSVDHLELDPPAAVVHTIGASVDFTSQPWSPADSCDQNGERLVATDSTYNWNSSDITVGVLPSPLINNSNPNNGFVAPTQPVTATSANTNTACNSGTNQCSTDIKSSTNATQGQPAPAIGSPVTSNTATFALQCGFKQSGQCVAQTPVGGGPTQYSCSNGVGSGGQVFFGEAGRCSNNNATSCLSDADCGTGNTCKKPTVSGDNPITVAVSKDQTTLYETVGGGVNVIDLSKPSSPGLITGFNIPSGIAINPTKNEAYVTNRGPLGSWGTTVNVIDLGTNKIIGSPITVGSDPERVAFSPDGTAAYVTNAQSNTVSAINTGTQLAQSISGFSEPEGIAVTQTSINRCSSATTMCTTDSDCPSGQSCQNTSATLAYVADSSNATITVIDLATNKTFPPLHVGANPYGMVASPDGKVIYAGTKNGKVLVIDPSKNAVTATINVAADGIENLGVSPDGRFIYASGLTTGLYVIDLQAAIPTAVKVYSAGVGAQMHGVAVTSKNVIYVAKSISINSGIVAQIQSIGTCQTDSDCNNTAATGQCGTNGQASGTCGAGNVCTNDPQVSCLDAQGHRSDKLCNFGVNTAGCCGARPWVENVTAPTADDQLTCRNAAFTVTFNTLMDTSSLLRTGKICSNNSQQTCSQDSDCGGGGTCENGNLTVVLDHDVSGGVCTDLSQAQLPWWQRIWNYVASLFSTHVDAATGFICYVPAQLSIHQVVDAFNHPIKTQVIISPTALLTNLQTYQVRVMGESNQQGSLGVAARSSTGVPMSGNNITPYIGTAGAANHPLVSDKICAIDHVDVDVNPELSFVQNAANPRTPDRPYDIFNCAGDNCVCQISAGGSVTGKSCRLVSAPNSPPSYVQEDQDLVAGNQHIYEATAYAATGGILSAQYRWSLADPESILSIPTGRSANNKEFFVQDQGQNGFANADVAAASGQGQCLKDGKVLSTCSNNPSQACESNGDCNGGLCNGGAKSCTFDDDCAVSGATCSGATLTSKTADVPVTVFLCQNPWSQDFQDGASEDAVGNFTTTYCLGNDASSLLPSLTVLPTNGGSPNVLKEWILKVRGNTPDAIGVRISSNPRHLSPEEWYTDQNFPKGSPSSTTVDGYPAVIDGRTIYIGAGNAVKPTQGPFAGQQVLFTNIVIFSYNQGAAAPTLNIFHQLLDNLQFNINLLAPGVCKDIKTATPVSTCSDDATKRCTADSDCGNSATCTGQAPPCLLNSDCSNTEFCSSAKAGIARDTIRLTSLLDNASKLETYRYGTSCAAVPPGSPGDADCNGKIDANDILLTRLYDTQYPDGNNRTPPVAMPADCKGADYDLDGQVTNADVTAVTNKVITSCKRDSGGPNYPALDSGTYIQGTSTSTWPSWTQTLNPALNAKLATDPLNTFAQCSTPYDSNTCWNETVKAYKCSGDRQSCALGANDPTYPPAVPVSNTSNDVSHVYTYTAYGVCAKAVDRSCLFDDDCKSGGQDFGPCRRGTDYALCGFMEACYQPKPDVVDESMQYNRFCEITPDLNATSDPAGRLLLPPINNGSCTTSGASLTPPPAPPASHRLTMLIKVVGLASGTVTDPLLTPPLDVQCGSAFCGDHNGQLDHAITEIASVPAGTPIEIKASPQSQAGVTWTNCDRVIQSGIDLLCQLTMGNTDRNIAVTLTPPPPTVTISADVTTITQCNPAAGTCTPVTISWSGGGSADHLVDFSANGLSLLPWSCGTNASGTCTLTPTDTTTYRVVVGNGGNPEATAAASVTIYVNHPGNLGGPPQAEVPTSVAVAPGTSTTFILAARDLDGCGGNYNIVTSSPTLNGVSLNATPVTCAGAGYLSSSVTLSAGQAVGSGTFTFHFDDSTANPPTGSSATVFFRVR